MPSRSVVLALLVAGSVLPFGAVRAQNPSADSIIQSLQPHGSLGGGTRGIRPVSPQPVEPPPPGPAAAGRRPAATAAARPAEAAPAPSVNLSVQFANGSAELTPAAVRTLSELGRALASTQLATYRFRIEGHTDTVGAADANKSLSERRAQAVVEFLHARFNIDPARLDAVGLGEDGLLVQTPPNTPEARNRRVQVINLGA